MIDPIFQSDGTYQLARKLLDGAALQQTAIAANIANSETPGYHRVEVSPDFAQHLRASVESGDFPQEFEAIKPALMEDRQTRSVRPDGNNVEVENEFLAMNKNSVEYEYLTDIVSSNIKQLKMAISGNISQA